VYHLEEWHKETTHIIFENVFTSQESFFYLNEMISSVCWQEESIFIFGRLIQQPRLISFQGNTGVAYTYSKKKHEAVYWTKCVKQVLEKTIIYLQQKNLKFEFNSCLCNFYRNGNDSMGWHADNEPELGQKPVLISVSFGAERYLNLRNKGENKISNKILLTNGSVLVMFPSFQNVYEHSISKKKNLNEPRINLTYRRIIS
jgi:alkylated DNA repair dioxygenase AlkB